MTNTRLEIHLEKILRNPGKWVHINKRKRRQTSRAITAERILLRDTIVTTLKLTGIPYEIKSGSPFTIRTKE